MTGWLVAICMGVIICGMVVLLALVTYMAWDENERRQEEDWDAGRPDRT